MFTTQQTLIIILGNVVPILFAGGIAFACLRADIRRFEKKMDIAYKDSRNDKVDSIDRRLDKPDNR